MHRIDDITAEADKNGAGKNGFTEGNPGLSIPPTLVTEEILNALQEEIANTVEGGGATLSKPTNTQLRDIVLGAKVATYSGNLAGVVSFAPTGWSGAKVVDIDAFNVGAAIYGMSRSVTCRRKILRNVGTETFRLVALEASAVTANTSIRTPQAFTDLYIERFQSVEVLLADGATEWSVVSHKPSLAETFALRLITGAEVVYYDPTGQTPTPRTRTKLVSPLLGSDSNGGSAWSGSSVTEGPNRISAVNGAVLRVPLEMPYGASVSRVRVGISNSGALTDWTMRVFNAVMDKTVSFAPTINVPALVTSGAASGDHILDSNDASMVAINVTDTNYVFVELTAPANASGGLAVVRWIEVTFADPGPRNY